MAFRRLAIEVFITAAISVGLGLLGPFGTFALPLGERLLLWVGVVLAGYVIYRPVQTVAHWLAEETAIPRWTALLIAGALAALPLSFVVGFAFSGMRYDPVLFGPGFPQLYLQVFGITALIQIVMHFLFPLLSPEDEVAEPMPQPRKPLTIEEVALPDRPTAPFFERLPKDIGDHLVCLEMQDH
jgi:hypothetical protein